MHELSFAALSIYIYKDHIDRNSRTPSKYIVSGINKRIKRMTFLKPHSKQNPHSSSSP